LPNAGDLDLTGLNLPSENLKELLKFDLESWKAEVPDIEKFFARFGDRLPERLKRQLRELVMRLEKFQG
ncbi:MAG: phosphoenolpyruvate carboxykinase (GTP), partial [Deltaproteobacteria bacterium]|nr:phosphoenolpyruvate carboxykinase (GTP) [Deltaproteobacteria bacterium]